MATLSMAAGVDAPHQRRFIMIESSERDAYDMIVECRVSRIRRQFHPYVILGETMHGPSLLRLFEEHLSLLAHVFHIELVRLPF